MSDQMGVFGWFFAISGALIVVAIVWMFNRLIVHRNRVREAWSGIDVQLKLRHDLVPNLVTAVKGYASHEKDVLEEVIRKRALTEDVKEHGDMEDAENDLSRSLVSVFALAEAYPELKADENFIDLHNNLVAIEDTLQLARRYYNGTVRDHNIYVESFPSNVIAGLFDFPVADYFEIELASERVAPKVSLSDEP